jgi:hypothetical protein
MSLGGKRLPMVRLRPKSRAKQPQPGGMLRFGGDDRPRLRLGQRRLRGKQPTPVSHRLLKRDISRGSLSATHCLRSSASGAKPTSRWPI